jgi:hypothetical protein
MKIGIDPGACFRQGRRWRRPGLSRRTQKKQGQNALLFHCLARFHNKKRQVIIIL